MKKGITVTEYHERNMDATRVSTRRKQTAKKVDESPEPELPQVEQDTPLIEIQGNEDIEPIEPIINPAAKRMIAPGGSITLTQHGMRMIGALNEDESAPEYQMSRIPQIEPFGVYKSQEQFVEFTQWMQLVDAALSFVPNWAEDRKAAWFTMRCGSVIRDLIYTFDLVPSNVNEPFSSLVDEIAQCFVDQSDSTVRHEAFMSVRQESGEPAGEYYTRLKRAARGLMIDPLLFRNQCISGLVDPSVRDLAITQQWSERDTISAAARKEGLSMRAAPHSVNMVGNGSMHHERSHTEPRTSPTREVAHVKRQGRGMGRKRRRGSPQSKNRGHSTSACAACGFDSHRFGKCPAVGKKCNKCGAMGHFATRCKQGNALSEVRQSVDVW